MPHVDAAVLSAFQESLLSPAVLERALEKLRARLSRVPDETTGRHGTLIAEMELLQGELDRLTAALAQGGDLPTVLAAVRVREQRLACPATEFAALDGASSGLLASMDAVLAVPGVVTWSSACSWLPDGGRTSQMAHFDQFLGSARLGTRDRAAVRVAQGRKMDSGSKPASRTLRTVSAQRPVRARCRIRRTPANTGGTARRARSSDRPWTGTRHDPHDAELAAQSGRPSPALQDHRRGGWSSTRVRYFSSRMCAASTVPSSVPVLVRSRG